MLKSAGRKTITLHKNYPCLAIYSNLHSVTMAFAYNTFHPRLVSAGLILYTLYNFFSLVGYITIDFAFTDNVL